MRRYPMMMSLPLTFFGGLAVLPACQPGDFNHVDSSIRSLPVGANASKFKASITCDVRHSSAARTVGGSRRDYKSSAETDFLSPGWESRIASDFDFFTKDNTGEAPGIPAVRTNQPEATGSAHSIVLIDIRTVDGVPHYYYYGNKNWNIPTETWSSSKTVSVGAFLHKLRTITNGKVGGDSTFPGGSIRSDMDPLNDPSSNQHGGWYKAMTGPSSVENFVRNWLLRGADSLGGFHGFSGGGEWDSTVTFTSPSGDRSPAITPDWNSVSSNSLAMITQAEYMKRIGVNFRDRDLLPRMGSYDSARSSDSLAGAAPSWTEADIQTLMFGDYPSGGIGGMMFDGMRDLPRMFKINGELDKVPDHKNGIERISGGDWVSVGKAGSGYSEARNKKEEIYMAYVCIPSVNGGEGIEFAIASRMSVSPGGNPLTRGWRTYGRIIDAVYPGIRQGERYVGAGEPWQEESGEAKAKVDTFLKASNAPSSELTDSEKCTFPAGNVLGYSARRMEGNHTVLTLRFADAACPTFDKEAHVFTDHFEFVTKS